MSVGRSNVIYTVRGVYKVGRVRLGYVRRRSSRTQGQVCAGLSVTDVVYLILWFHRVKHLRHSNTRSGKCTEVGNECNITEEVNEC